MSKTAARVTKSKISSLLLAYVSLGLFGYCDNIRGPVFVQLMQDYGVTNRLGSLFFALTSLVFTWSALMSPYWLIRWGAFRLFSVMLFLAGLSQLVFAISPAYEITLGGAIIMGLAFGALSVMQNVWVIESSPPRWSRALMNGLHAQYALASVLAPMSASLVLQLGWSYRSVFFIGFILLAGLWFLKFLWPRPAEISPSLPAVAAQWPWWRRWFFPLEVKISFLPLSLALSFYVAAEVLLSSRLSQYLQVEQGMGVEQAGILVSGFFLCLLLGRIFFSLYTPAWSALRFISAMLLAAIGVLLLGLFWHYYLLIGLGFILSPLYAYFMIYAGQRFKKDIAQVTALCICISGVLLVTMNGLVGWVSDAWGIRPAMFLALGFITLSMGFLLLLWRQELPQ
ncbi:MAG: MFS transporter [Bdellovibrionaceae bacterium]|jgi:fucose permease|nr:MFS transporter [Pseudobdellovibrionaceae bacterium]